MKIHIGQFVQQKHLFEVSFDVIMNVDQPRDGLGTPINDKISSITGNCH